MSFEQSDPFSGPSPGGDTSAEPLLYYKGQPYSKASATSALARFDADQAKVNAALGGDGAARQERAALREMSLGRQPEGVLVMPVDEAGVREQMLTREEQETEARLDVFAKYARMTPELRAQQKRWLATQEQHDFAVAEKARLLRDPEFSAKVVKGYPDETDRWVKTCQAAAATVAPPDYDWSKDSI